MTCDHCQEARAKHCLRGPQKFQLEYVCDGCIYPAMARYFFITAFPANEAENTPPQGGKFNEEK
jgi:hypothetical protein